MLCCRFSTHPRNCCARVCRLPPIMAAMRRLSAVVSRSTAQVGRRWLGAAWAPAVSTLPGATSGATVAWHSRSDRRCVSTSSAPRSSSGEDTDEGASPYSAQEVEELVQEMRGLNAQLSQPGEQEFDVYSGYSRKGDTLFELLRQIVMFPEFTIPMVSNGSQEVMLVTSHADESGTMSVLHAITTDGAFRDFVAGLSGAIDENFSSKTFPGASLPGIMDAIRADLESVGQTPYVNLSIDGHDPSIAIALPGEYTGDMLKSIGASVHAEALLRFFGVVPTMPALAFDDDEVVEGLKTALDHVYTVLAIVPAADMTFDSEDGAVPPGATSLAYVPVPKTSLNLADEAEGGASERELAEAMGAALDNLHCAVFTHRMLAVRFVHFHGRADAATGVYSEEDQAAPPHLVPVDVTGHQLVKMIRSNTGGVIVNPPVFGEDDGSLSETPYGPVLVGAPQSTLDELLCVSAKSSEWVQECERMGLVQDAKTDGAVADLSMGWEFQDEARLADLETEAGVPSGSKRGKGAPADRKQKKGEGARGKKPRSRGGRSRNSRRKR